MATNKISGRGRTLQITAGAAYSSGDVILIGDQGLSGVCVHDIASGASGSVEVKEGIVVDLGCKGTDETTPTAIAIGDKVYHAVDNSGYECNVLSTDTFVGYALEAVDADATDTINVLMVSRA